MVADDDEANRELLSEILSREGFGVVTASDGAAALEQFKRTNPDIVLLDVMMPLLSGFEVCRQLKGNRETCLTPIILTTSLSAKEDRVAGIQAGADDFLSRPIDKLELLARVRSLLRIKAHTDELERAELVLFALARSIEAKDAYTQNHCDRLAQYAVDLGKRLGLLSEQIVALHRGGIVHDIGKVAVPDAILLKPGKLTEDEWKVMREHPVAGERICAPLKSFGLVLPIIRHHHERLDGSGYPDGLKGEQVPVTARVLQIVDVYDALTTTRPYRQALSTAEALEIMEAEIKMGWWDPNIFGEFARLMTISPDQRTRSAAAGTQ